MDNGVIKSLDGRNKTRAHANRCAQLIQERQSAAVVSRMKNDVTTRQLRDLNQHARVHAEAFRKILVATGLTREADVLKRWHNREQYVSEVEHQVKMLHERLEHLVENNKELTADLRSGKYQPELETAKNRAELVRVRFTLMCAPINALVLGSVLFANELDICALCPSFGRDRYFATFNLRCQHRCRRISWRLKGAQCVGCGSVQLITPRK